jgi:rod shape-determining protein MreD
MPMIEAAGRQLLIGTILFGISFVLLMFLRLLPLSPGLMGWPGPDVALCLTLAWVLRRPDQMSALAIVLLFLLEDVILYRPLGLWPAIVLLATEAARLREPRWRDQPFMFEWLRVAILMGMMLLGYRIVQILFLLPVPALGQVILQYLASIAAYPLTVFAARWLVGLRRISPAEADRMRYAG